MRMFDEAKQWAEEAARSGAMLKGPAAAGGAGGTAAVAELMSRQAEWSEETANYEAAVEMYIKVRGWQQFGCVLHMAPLLVAAR